jgi:nucleoside-diphosphate-sugar epimerase
VGYLMRWGGRCQLEYAANAAAIFIAAARAEHRGAGVFNLGEPESHIRDVVEAIEAAALEAQGLIEFEDAWGS